MQKKLSKLILYWALGTFNPKPKKRDKFIDTVGCIILIMFDLPIWFTVLAVGAFFGKPYLAVFALFNTIWFRRKGGDHSPASCFIASVAIFTLFFVACVKIDNWVVEYLLAIGLAFYYKKWSF